MDGLSQREAFIWQINHQSHVRNTNKVTFSLTVVFSGNRGVLYASADAGQLIEDISLLLQDIVPELEFVIPFELRSRSSMPIDYWDGIALPKSIDSLAIP